MRASTKVWTVVLGWTLAGCTAGEPAEGTHDLTAEAPSCTDVPPGDTYTCGEQVGWGKCNEPWMDGACDRSCGRCAETTLIDPQASESAEALMTYLESVQGDQVLAGQQGREEADYMAALTGHHPALLGLDLMNYSPSRVEHGASSDSTDQAIDWSEAQGGLVTLSWHWNAPGGLVDSSEWPWWKGFYAKATTFDLPRAMNVRDSAERQLLLRDIDAIAAELERLDALGVPVLWRPLHEASAGWFWWGAHGREPYLALWRLLYDRLVNHHGLHNLIWVWNGQDAAWYPGDPYVDIVAEDIYDQKRDYDPQEDAYLRADQYAGATKLVALSETGTLPDPERMLASRARWSWFMLWSGDFAKTEAWNEDAMKRRVYESDFVTTLDELPSLRVE